jgi:DNA-directed RNA polymerase subunit H (RpoH/RPB5)
MESIMTISLKEIKQTILAALKVKDKNMKHVTEKDILVEATTENGDVVGISNIRFTIDVGK